MPGHTHSLTALATVALIAGASVARAQDAIESFYRGKTITMMIGSNPGGGYDAYGRLVGRHITKYIPGHPVVVPSNMAGAGGNTVANYIYVVAPRDGTVITASSPGSLLDPLLAEQNNFTHDPLKLNYLGSANGEVFTCYAHESSGVLTFEDAFKKELIVGVSGGTTHDMPRALVNVLGVKYRLIAGYPGTREISLAIDKGEVQGMCGQGIANMSWQRPDWFVPNSPIRILAQESIKGDPELNKRGVPRTLDFAKTPEQKQILEIVYAQGVFTRPFFLAPDVPKERVEALRKAFLQTLADPEFMAEADKQKLQINPMTGQELEEMVRKIYATPPDIVAKVRKAIEAQ